MMIMAYDNDEQLARLKTIEVWLSLWWSQMITRKWSKKGSDHQNISVICTTKWWSK